MRVARPAEQRLVGLVVAPDAQRDVLFLESVQRGHQLVFVAAGARLDGYEVHGRGRLGHVERDRGSRLREGVAGRCLQQFGGDHVVAGADLCLLLLLFALGQQQRV